MSERLTPEERVGMRRMLAATATPPWTSCGDDPQALIDAGVYSNGIRIATAASPTHGLKAYREPNMKFMAAAWSFVQRALDDLDALEKDLRFERDVTKQAVAERDTLRVQLKEWKRTIEGLTPSGSEFVDDPKRCAEYIRHRTNWPRQIGELKTENAALRARCEQLQRENEALVRGAEAGPTR